jgi:hypothetical protein
MINIQFKKFILFIFFRSVFFSVKYHFFNVYFNHLNLLILLFFIIDRYLLFDRNFYHIVNFCFSCALINLMINNCSFFIIKYNVLFEKYIY